MFFDDATAAVKKHSAIRALPPIPSEIKWTTPREFPRLDGAAVIALDTETWEPDFDHGPGWGRGKGRIVGVSLAAEDALGNRGKWYFPVRHEVEAHANLDPASTFAWLKSVLETPHIPKIGANMPYDVGWLVEENIRVMGRIHDVQIAEALLEEEGLVNLEFLGHKYCGRGKDSGPMYRWGAAAYGGNPNGTQRGNIYRMPPRLVGAYAEEDADLPLDIYKQQRGLLTAQRLDTVYDMECKLVRLLVRMRYRGVSVDVEQAEKMYVECGRIVERRMKWLKHRTGVEVTSMDATAQMAKLFESVGITVPLTPTGKPSVTKPWMSAQEHPLAAFIIETKELVKMRGTFLRNGIIERHHNGVVHPMLKSLRGTKDDGEKDGTRSGRFACATPNIQQIPSRSKLGKRIRSCFVPRKGKRWWRKFDYSQIEYRLLVHYAVGPGSDEVRAQYNSDPDTDYHVITQKLVFDIVQVLIERKPIKNINFGLLYGMGVDKLARQLGKALDEAKKILTAYHTGNPYVRATMSAAFDEVQQHGFVETVLGRRSRFDMWEPVNPFDDDGGRARAVPYEEALRNYGPDIQRAYGHKAINRKLQGGSAEMMKLCMVQMDEAGIFEYTGLPSASVHDELDFDDDGDQNEAFIEAQRIMEACIKLRVPVRADMDLGNNWGDAMPLDDLLKESPDDERVSVLQRYDEQRSKRFHAAFA